jgi:hypothetical protein
MNIIGMIPGFIIIEPQYDGDCEHYIALSDSGVDYIKNVLSIKEYKSADDYKAQVYYNMSLEEYTKGLDDANEKAKLSRLINDSEIDELPF